MVGISHASFKTAIELAHDAERWGAAAVQLLAPLRPFAGPPTQGDLIAYFEAIGRETKLPITLYLNPGPAPTSPFPIPSRWRSFRRCSSSRKARAISPACRGSLWRSTAPATRAISQPCRCCSRACSSAAPARPCRRRAPRSPAPSSTPSWRRITSTQRKSSFSSRCFRQSGCTAVSRLP